MAVAFDAVGPSSAGTFAQSTAGPLTWSHTCTGSDLLLTVGIAWDVSNAGTPTTLTVTYNSVSMTSVGRQLSNNSSTSGFIELFALQNPATGTNTVSAAWSDPTLAGGQSIIGGSVSFTGVASYGTPVKAFGLSGTLSATVNGTAASSMVVDAACWGSGGAATGSQTERWERDVNADTGSGDAAQSTAAGGGNVTMSYTITSDAWGIIAVELFAAGGATALQSGSAFPAF